MLNYNAIEIFTSESARCNGKPVPEAVIDLLRESKIAARCMVTRGIAGFYETGEIVTGRVEILSANMPIRVYILLPSTESEQLLTRIETMIIDGIIALHDVKVISHKTRNMFLPHHLVVRDVMTAHPKSVAKETSLREIVRLLLSSVFTGVPVVDAHDRPVGVVTQGDLIRKGGLSLRLGLVAESGQENIEAFMLPLAVKAAAEIMTAPAITISESSTLVEAVKIMLSKGVKRLPVVDREGKLSGMLSRLDIFRVIMRHAPDWKRFQARRIEVGHLKRVADIVRRDVHMVAPGTPLEAVINIIDRNDIQRVAVVDDQKKMLGLISDRDLLRYFKPHQKNIWRFLAKIKGAFKQEQTGEDVRQRLSEVTAAMAMTTGLTTAREEMLIEEAIDLMLAKGLKRLPVVDASGCFAGMISRDSLLRAGFAAFCAVSEED